MMAPHRAVAPALAAGLAFLLVASAPRAEPAASCRGEPGLSRLDFWLGSWEVCAVSEPAGHDRVGKLP